MEMVTKFRFCHLYSYKFCYILLLLNHSFSKAVIFYCLSFLIPANMLTFFVLTLAAHCLFALCPIPVSRGRLPPRPKRALQQSSTLGKKGNCAFMREAAVNSDQELIQVWVKITYSTTFELQKRIINIERALQEKIEQNAQYEERWVEYDEKMKKSKANCAFIRMAGVNSDGELIHDWVEIPHSTAVELQRQGLNTEIALEVPLADAAKKKVDARRSMATSPELLQDEKYSTMKKRKEKQRKTWWRRHLRCFGK